MANELEQQLGAILNDPAMMHKIMTVANSFSSESQDPPQKNNSASNGIDIELIQKFSGLISQSGIDQQQKSLLSALSPFLSKGRIQKLENAMRAARMAKLAGSFVNPSKLGR